jgi:hypothetical protein
MLEEVIWNGSQSMSERTSRSAGSAMDSYDAYSLLHEENLGALSACLLATVAGTNEIRGQAGWRP